MECRDTETKKNACEDKQYVFTHLKLSLDLSLYEYLVFPLRILSLESRLLRH